MDQKAPYALYIDRMHSEYIVAGAHVAFSVGNQNESFYGIHQDILPIQLCTAVKQAVVLYAFGKYCIRTKNRIILTKQSGRPLKLKVVIRCRKK